MQTHLSAVFLDCIILCPRTIIGLFKISSMRLFLPSSGGRMSAKSAKDGISSFMFCSIVKYQSRRGRCAPGRLSRLSYFPGTAIVPLVKEGIFPKKAAYPALCRLLSEHPTSRCSRRCQPRSARRYPRCRNRSSTTTRKREETRAQRHTIYSPPCIRHSMESVGLNPRIARYIFCKNENKYLGVFSKI